MVNNGKYLSSHQANVPVTGHAVVVIDGWRGLRKGRILWHNGVTLGVDCAKALLFVPVAGHAVVVIDGCRPASGF